MALYISASWGVGVNEGQPDLQLVEKLATPLAFNKMMWEILLLFDLSYF